MSVKILGAGERPKGHCHGIESVYTLLFPATKRIIRVWSFSRLLERITENCARRAIPCIAYHYGKPIWSSDSH